MLLLVETRIYYVTTAFRIFQICYIETNESPSVTVQNICFVAYLLVILCIIFCNSRHLNKIH